MKSSTVGDCFKNAGLNVQGSRKSPDYTCCAEKKGRTLELN